MSFKTLAIILSLLTGCKSKDQPVLCSLAIKTTVYAASGIAIAFNCSNLAEISADLSDPILNADLCQQQKENQSIVAMMSIADAVCPSVGDMLIKGSSNALPAAWGCSGGILETNTIKDSIVNACKQLIPY